MIGSEPSIDLDFQNGFFHKGVQLKNFFWIFVALIEVASRPFKNAVNRACGHLGGPLGFSKLFPGASSGTPGASREGKNSVLAPSSPRSAAEQIDCIFAMDYGALGPPTL